MHLVKRFYNLHLHKPAHGKQKNPPALPAGICKMDGYVTGLYLELISARKKSISLQRDSMAIA